MRFWFEKYLTIDDSVVITCDSDEDEYIFQFALSKKEIKDLQNALKQGLKMLNKELRWRKRRGRKQVK